MAALEMQVEQVTLDPVLGAPVVILREKEGERAVPIWIGQVEAAAIVSELRSVPMARPSSHDLMKEILFRLRASVSHVLVKDLRNGTYFAELSLETSEGSIRLDSRPSDAIALALRTNAPIFVEQQVVDRACRLTSSIDGVDDVGGRPKVLFDDASSNLDGVLEGMAEEDFGKWKM